MDTKALVGAAIAAVPAETTGLLIMKIVGNVTQEEHGIIIEGMGKALSDAGLKCGFVAISGQQGYFDFTLQHLTDEALREIGFQRLYSEFT